MRNMSFFLTTEQIKARTKTVTRRFGWWKLKPGDLVCAVRKGMGLKKGEKIERLATLRIVSTRREPLDAITWGDCDREGFSGMMPADFVLMLTKHYGCNPYDMVNRIEFEYLEA